MRSAAALFLFSLIALSGLPPARGIVGEDALPKADWISHAADSETPQTGYFRKQFTAPPGLVRAVLLGASDQRMSVLLNGEPAAEMAGFERGASIDVTRHVKPGQNLLAVRVTNERGLAAFRLMLELATERGRQSWVVSDGSWLASLVERADWHRPEFDAHDWTPAFAHGEAGLERWGNAFEATKAIDAYNSWMLAKGAAQATDPAAIKAPPGFRVELLRSAQPDEGSWIALAFDLQGRLTVAREQLGLLRFSLGRDRIEKAELIEDTLRECRGLLYAHGALYVNANNSKGFYRLRDTDGDDRFDEKLLLLATRGGVGHGRNQIRLGPDGLIYLVHGNDPELPANISADSPLRNYAADQLFPQRWGENAGGDIVRPPHGCILATDRDGKSWRLIAGGLRNALDIAFNEDGEMFTYDADNERDLGTPWYKPTRVLHVVSGGEYGWRPGAGKLPAYQPDTLPSVVDIGIGSPCGIEFGTHSRFPEKWRRALFIADWAYGRILAVQLQPRGASYGGVAESFVSGRPLNVTDLTFGPDGAMYFVTGGRGTQSGLYRVSYDALGATPSPAAQTLPEKNTEDGVPPNGSAAELRGLRRKLEALHAAPSEDALALIWRHLGHDDRFIRYAARVALEAQPLEHWREKALAERDTGTLLTALLALSRVAPKELQPRLLGRVQQLESSSLTDEQKLLAIRICELSCMRMGRPPAELADAIAQQLDAIYPAQNQALNHELCRLLIYLGSPQAVAKTATLLGSARTPGDLLHYLFHLRHVREGWTGEERRMAFTALQRAERQQGARDYLDALRLVRRELTAALSSEDREALASMLAPQPAATLSPPVDMSKYQFRKVWTLADFPPEMLADRGSAAAGREAFAAAQCVLCHRAGNESGGSVGPDLTGVAARFGRRELLEQIIEPSKVIDEKFRNIVVTLKDGAVFAGAVEEEDDARLVLTVNSAADELLEIAKVQIAERKVSDQSPMPPGLLSILTKEQIVDLLTYLEASTAPASAVVP